MRFYICAFLLVFIGFVLGVMCVMLGVLKGKGIRWQDMSINAEFFQILFGKSK